MIDAAAAPANSSSPEQPQRSVADVLAGRLRLTLAGRQFVLPVLTVRQNEEWMASLKAELAPLIAVEDDERKALEMLAAFSDRLLDFIYSYDVTGVLPERGDWERDAYPHELIRGVFEIQMAANPTLAFAYAEMVAEADRERNRQVGMLTTIRSARSSSSPRRTAGRSPRSAKN